jgi:two-component system response regulator protein BraR/BceR
LSAAKAETALPQKTARYMGFLMGIKYGIVTAKWLLYGFNALLLAPGGVTAKDGIYTIQFERSMGMYRIFLVEDDAVIAGAIKRHMETWGCEVGCVEDFGNVLGEFVKFDPQLVLLDISLPFFNGYHWCAEIRRISKVPIIFLSSTSDNMNIVMAVNMGGDDFIPKPFVLSVLTAKVQALLRRTYDFAGTSQLIECGGAVLNLSDGTLTNKGEKIELTKNEYRILQLLMENKGRVVTRDLMMTRLWETDSYVDENTLTVNITRLRHKLDAAGLFGFIQTKKGLGYMVG